MVYILGSLAGDLMFCVDNYEKLESNTEDIIKKMKSQEFF
jgi:hypothetical protein